MEANDKARASRILRRRFIGEDVARRASIEQERNSAEIAQMIHDLRAEAGLSQTELAELVGTTQSVISRLEGADYDGHSLSMLRRIAQALNKRLVVTMTGSDASRESENLRFVFRQVMEKLRLREGLTVESLARKLGCDREEIIAMERHAGYRPSPLMIHKLAAFYRIPMRRLAELAGAVERVPAALEATASRFAAQAESFSRLTREQRKVLDDFVRCLRTELAGAGE